MFVEQRERIVKIINNISGLPAGISLAGLQSEPNSLDNVALPVVLPVLPSVTYPRLSASDFIVSARWNLYVYIRPIATGNAPQHSIEIYEMLNVLADAFLSRPRLQLKDAGLSHVRDVEFTNWRNLRSPISYPIGIQVGALYWGAIGDLTIYQRKIKSIGD